MEARAGSGRPARMMSSRQPHPYGNSKHLVLVDISVFCAPGELWVAIRLDLAPTVLARACIVRIAARDFCTVPEWATAGGGAVLHPSGTSTSLYAGTVF